MVMGEVTADDLRHRRRVGTPASADPARPCAAPRPHELRGALRPAELAEAAVLGDLGLVLEVLGWFVPLVGAVFQGLAIVPFAALGSRHRARTCVVAIFAASSVSFLVGGVGIVIQTAIAGSLGLAVGTAYRRQWSPSAAVLIATVTAGIPVAVISLVAEALSPGLRRLAFAQVEILWRDVRAVLNLLRVPFARVIRRSDTSVGHRPLVADRAGVRALRRHARGRALCPRYLWPLLVRLEHDSPAPPDCRHAGLLGGAVAGGGDPAPVPVELERVSYQYPGSFTWAVAEVSLSVEPKSFLALVGPNGSGKSTLVRLLAGRLSPTLGTVRRAGDPGLGVPRRDRR